MAKRKRDDLKSMLANVSAKVEKEKKFEGNEEMLKANQNAIKLFSQPNDVFSQDGEGVQRNVTNLGTGRVRRYLRRSNVDWKVMDATSLFNWLFENWDKVLRVLFTIFTIFFI